MGRIETRQWLISGGRSIPLDRPVLIGILNATPDSFSDGGRHDDPARAAAHAGEMINAGATIIDVGGESTRPGAERVDDDEQIRRVVPVIERLVREHPGVAISVDTTRAPVARGALDAGASIINDVSGGSEDPAMLPLAGERGAGLILMHRLRAPDADRYSDRYDETGRPDYSRDGGVVESVARALGERAAAAIDAGVEREAIVLDPGLGFGKTVAQNFDLIANAPRLLGLGYPMLSAASRKSFIGRVTGVDEPSRRVAGSVAVTIAHALAGVRLFRVHDVGAHARALADLPPNPGPIDTTGLTHAGGLVYRTSDEHGVEFLLVRASRDPTLWVIPKGHIDPDERPPETAIREVAEEASVRAVIEHPIGIDTFEAPRGPVRAAYYLMRFEEDLPPQEDRERVWAPPREAMAMARFPGARRIVAHAAAWLGVGVSEG